MDKCVPQLSRISIHGASRDCLPLTTLIFRKYCCQTINQFSQRNNVLHAPDSNTGGFDLIDTCFFNSAEYANLEHHEP
jgi:hypothetical protein